ncbi:RagB/SusD family nutrient uptake outer membrane protein [Flavobacterium faecale]|uniref:RagB/SusD family nutrient uptake outer membrane protein n=1 Tax=Flavobacterium faecale TaxID=1355330 RepID=UPI003AAA8643
MKKYIDTSRIKIFALLLTVVALSTSCNDILDLQPISEIGQDNFWKTNKDAESGVIGIYDGMQAAYREKYFLWGECRSDNEWIFNASASAFNIELSNQNITNANASSLKWDVFYNMINRCNLAIKNIPAIPAHDKNFLAEAYAVRAFAYFDAIRVWGAVPLYTEPTLGIDNIEKSRTDATTVMNTVIIPDMLKAEELMTRTNDKFRFSKVSVLCLQAEVYMWLKDYPKAKEALDKMIAIGGHSLVTSVQAWEDLFYNNPPSVNISGLRGKIQTGPELMFSINYNLAEEQDNPGSRNANRSGVANLFFAGLPSFYMSPTVEAKWQEKFPIDKAGWEAKYPGVAPVLTREVSTTVGGVIVNTTEPVYGDWRYFLCREGGFASFGSFPVGQARIAKWQKTNFNVQFDETDIVIYRYAGMLLLLAEAENQLNNTPGVVPTTNKALTLVNQIRTARKLPLVTPTEFGATKEARENFILDERQLELFGEGKRWWDLVRTNIAIDIINAKNASIPGTVPLTNDRILFPVYFEHLIENPKLLPQNLGYTN